MMSTGGGGAVVAGHQRVQRGNLRFGAGQHDDAVGLDDGVGKRGPQLAPLPETDDADAGLFPKAGVAHRLAGEDGVARGKLRDLQPAIGADDVRVAAPVSTRLARYSPSWCLSGSTVVAPLSCSTSMESSSSAIAAIGSAGAISRAVIVMLVFAVSSQLASSMRALSALRPLVGGAAVVVAGDDRDAFADHPGRHRRVRFDHVIRDVLGPQPLDQAGGDRRRTR